MELELTIKGTPEEIQRAITKLTGAPAAEPWFQTHEIPQPEPAECGSWGGKICISCGKVFDTYGTRRRRLCDECKEGRSKVYQERFKKKRNQER
jgi:hypothetical protein